MSNWPETIVTPEVKIHFFFQISDTKKTNFLKSKLIKFKAKFVKSNQNKIKIIQISPYSGGRVEAALGDDIQ